MAKCVVSATFVQQSSTQSEQASSYIPQHTHSVSKSRGEIQLNTTGEVLLSNFLFLIG
jgi:hypothetical protein